MVQAEDADRRQDDRSNVSKAGQQRVEEGNRRGQEKERDGNLIKNETRTRKNVGATELSGSEPRGIYELDKGDESDGRETRRTRGDILGESGYGLRETLTAKEKSETNKKVREILNKKTDDEITEEDTAILRKYSGAGGLEKAGEGGRGLLDEYYTPKPIIEKMYFGFLHYKGVR